MHKRTALLAVALLAACSDAVSPGGGRVRAPLFSFSPNGITLSRSNGSLNETGRQLAKGFDPKNPHHGDAVIATFFWLGSTFIVDSVIDFIADLNNTRAGNQYHLVEYVTTGGYSMATYIATNIQNFPDTSSVSGQILAVRAYLRDSVADGGVTISAWTGVEDNFAVALGDHHSAMGSDTGSIPAHTAPIAVNAGALAFTVTMGAVHPTGFTGLVLPDGFTSTGRGSDTRILEDAAYAVQANPGTIDPQWTWLYGAPARPWLVTTLALNAATGAANQPPTAAFSSSCSALTCAFTSTSSDPDGSISAYSWTFGDGTTSTVQNPSHSYSAGGTYTVTLTVTDNQGATNAVSHSVTVNAANQPPTANFPAPSCTGLSCSFTSTSSDPDGTIASYNWTFGDGTSATVQNPSKTYAAAGSYSVTLSVTDNQGAQSAPFSRTVTVTAPNQAPTANFPAPSCTGLSCSFTSTSSDPDGTIASYSWTFGDGTSSTVQNPSKTYAAAGSYTVTLRVTDNQGAQSAPFSRTVTVTAPNQAPTANFPAPSCTGLSCSFTSTSSDPDGTIASYSWTFGDGTSATVQNPSKTYGAPGSYTVTLRVTDNQGAQSAPFSRTVAVTAPNQPPVVNAGPDQTAVTGLLYSFSPSFSDANGNGPWSYTINWGDGSSTTGSRTAQGAFSVGHTYVIILPRSFTITVTVRDASGASGSDQKVVSVLLL
jgi:PKD repeat protein